MLTQKQSRFGFEYCKDYNGTKAAIRAGYSEAGAGDTGSRLLLNPDVQLRIAEREEEIAAEAEVDRAWVFKEWCDIAKADPRELMQLVVRACPRCWPAGLELDDPNPCCALPLRMSDGSNVGGCGGAGVQLVKLTPTNQLSRRAARLIASIKETKNGIEYKLRDQDAAVNNIANALGVLKPAAASASLNVNLGTGEVTDWKNLSDEELELRIAIEEEKERAKALSEGTIEGTLSLVDGNPNDIKALPADSIP